MSGTEQMFVAQSEKAFHRRRLGLSRLIRDARVHDRPENFPIQCPIFSQSLLKILARVLQWAKHRTTSNLPKKN